MTAALILAAATLAFFGWCMFLDWKFSAITAATNNFFYLFCRIIARHLRIAFAITVSLALFFICFFMFMGEGRLELAICLVIAAISRFLFKGKDFAYGESGAQDIMMLANSAMRFLWVSIIVVFMFTCERMSGTEIQSNLYIWYQAHSLVSNIVMLGVYGIWLVSNTWNIASEIFEGAKEFWTGLGVAVWVGCTALCIMGVVTYILPILNA